MASTFLPNEVLHIMPHFPDGFVRFEEITTIVLEPYPDYGSRFVTSPRFAHSTWMPLPNLELFTGS